MQPPNNQASIEIRDPRLFTGRALVIVCAFGLLLVIPVLGAMLVVSSLQFGFWTAVIPLLTICGATVFLPFGFGNTYVTRLVRELKDDDLHNTRSFVVQVTLCPRLRSGARSILEDADDIGRITLTETAMIFQGDSVRCCIPYSHLQGVRLESIGLRGLFVYPCVVVSVTGLPSVTSFKIADRTGWFLPTSRHRTRELYEGLLAAVKG